MFNPTSGLLEIILNETPFDFQIEVHRAKFAMKLNLMAENDPLRRAVTTNEVQMAKRTQACFQRLNREQLGEITENRRYNT